MSRFMSRRSLQRFALTTALVFGSNLLAPLLPTALAKAAPMTGAPKGIPLGSSPSSRRIELPERRTTHSKTFLNPDGTFTTDSYSKPIHFRDATGFFRPIQNTLVNDAGGSVIRNAANLYQANFKQQMQGEFFSFKYRGRSAGLDLVGGRVQSAQWHDNTLTYTDVLDGLDLVYITESDHVKEDIVLKSPSATQSLTFRMRLDGVTWEQTNGGQLLFRDIGSGELLWTMPRMYMRDAAGALSGDVTVNVSEAGQTLRFEIKPNMTWLRDPKRQYPVVIDPTMAFQPDVSGGLDTTISSANALDDVNLGFDPSLTVGDGYSSLLKFDLGALPRGTLIDSATVKLSSISSPPTGNSTGVDAPAAAPVLSASSYTSALDAGTYSVRYTYVTPQGESLASPPQPVTIAKYQAIDVNVGAFPPLVSGMKLYVARAGETERFTANSDRTTAMITALSPTGDPVPTAATATFIRPPASAPQASETAAATGTTGFAAGTYQVQYTYLNALGESSASPAQRVTVAAGKAIAVMVRALPAGVTSANVYIGTDGGLTFKVGNVDGATAIKQVSYNAAPALTTSQAPVQVPAVLDKPTSPSVTAVTGDSAFFPGTYDVAYTFFAPNGETAASDRVPATIATAGQTLTVTALRTGLPPGATGMRVYMGESGGPLYLVTSQAAPPVNSQGYPYVNVLAPLGFRRVKAPSRVSTGTLSATTAVLTTPSRLHTDPQLSYSLVAQWLYPAYEETSTSEVRSVRPAPGQGIDTRYGDTTGKLPAKAIGTRIYMGPDKNKMWLTAGSMGVKTIVMGDLTAPVAPTTSTAQLAAPVLGLLSPSSLAPTTYQVAYTWTTASAESVPSGKLPVTVTNSQSIQVPLVFPAGVTGANIYLGTSTTNLRLAKTVPVPGDPKFTVGLTALPASDSAVLNENGRGTWPTGTATASWGDPAKDPQPKAVSGSTLPAGTYSVRYTGTDGLIETAPSLASTISVTGGQLVTVQLPPLPAGLPKANVYMGPVNDEKGFAAGTGVAPGVPIQISDLPAGTAVPATGSAMLAAPSVTIAPGTASSLLSGDVYFSYSFAKTVNGATVESLRSPETVQTFTGPGGNSAATVTVGTVPAWATTIKVWSGAAPGEGKLVYSGPIPASNAVTVEQLPPNGVAVSQVTTPWSELDATWVRASGSAPWFDRGGDYDHTIAISTLGGGATVSADLTSLVRDWANGNRPNYGVLLHGTGAPVRFASSDHNDPALRPMLSVTYREAQAGPRVTLTAGAPSGNIPLTASVVPTDPGAAIDRVEFYVNNALIATSRAEPYTTTWSTADQPPGYYTIVARAYDKWGREGRSDWALQLADSFEDQLNLDTTASTVLPDPTTGSVSLPISRVVQSVQAVTASSELPPELFSADTLLNGNTLWRSPGQQSADATESIYLSGNGKIGVKPFNPADRLTVKAQQLNDKGDVVSESDTLTLDSEQSFSYYGPVRLVFGNLKHNLASGLYHAEIAALTGNLTIVSAGAYHAAYEAHNAVDGSAATGWFSSGQTSPSAQEFLDLKLTAPANALHIKPRTPGVTATIAVYDEKQQAFKPVVTIPTLDEGLYLLPLGADNNRLASDRIRIYFTNLVGTAGSGGSNLRYAGVSEVVPYLLNITNPTATVVSRELVMPAASGQFLLDVTDAQPAGSRIDYALYDGTSWQAITPRIPLNLPAPVTRVRLRASLTSASPDVIPSLGAWRLYSQTPTNIMLSTGDRTPPTVQLVDLGSEVLSGTVPIHTLVDDNVGVTKVELFVDNNLTTPVASLTGNPLSPSVYLSLNTLPIPAGVHMLRAKAYDAAGNVGSSVPAPLPAPGMSTTFTTPVAIDLPASTYAAVNQTLGALVNSAQNTHVAISASGTNTRTFTAVSGVIKASAANVSDTSGCVSGSIELKDSTATVLVSDQLPRGECRNLQIAYYNSVPGANYTLTISQETTGGTYSGALDYFAPLSSSGSYGTDAVISQPAIMEGSIATVTLNANAKTPSGTQIAYWVSADDGLSWDPATPGVATQVTNMGNKLRVKAQLKGYTPPPPPPPPPPTSPTPCPPPPGTGMSLPLGTSCPTAGEALLATPAATTATVASASASVTPELYSFSADVTQYLAAAGATVATFSQVAVPTNLTATMGGNQATLDWTRPSTSQSYTYNVYRSTSPHPVGKAYLVGTGISNVKFVDGINLLRNSSFEGGSPGGIPDYWTTNYPSATCAGVDTNESVAGNRSLKIDCPSPQDWSISQSVGNPLTWPANTTFTLSARSKVKNLVPLSPAENLKITLTYADQTTATSTRTVTGDKWGNFNVSITAAKAVSQVTATLEMNGKGTVWYDTAELDTRGATVWNAGELDSTKTYYYQVTAIDSSGKESASSNEVSTAAPAAAGLGLQGFWPYRGLDLAGGEGFANMANGNLVYTATDMVYPSRLLANVFRRTYNSQGANTKTSLGYGWDFNWNWKLTPGTDVVLKQGDGAQFTFKSAAGGYEVPAGLRMRLTNLPNGGDRTYTLVSFDNNLRYDFDATGVLKRVSEPNGNALSLGYQGVQLKTIQNSTGQTITLEYAPDGHLAYVLHPGEGNAGPYRVAFKYDRRDNLIQVTDLEGNSVQYGYDESHRLTSVKDAVNPQTTIEYTGLPGSIQKVTYADGAFVSFNYTPVSNSFTDERGFETTYVVNGTGQLTKLTYHYGADAPKGAGDTTASQLYEYDTATWRTTKYTNELGKAWTIAYDGYGNTVSVTDPDGKRTSNLWTANDYPSAPGQVLNLPVQTIDALGNTTTYTHDGAGNLVQMQDPMLQTTSFGYEQSTGLRTSTTDANGNKTTYAYDGKGWLSEQKDALNHSTTYTYDLGGNLYTVTPPLHPLTRYVYDRLGRQKQITLPDGSIRLFSYDAAGNLTQSTDEAGADTKYTYDIRNRATATTQWPALNHSASDPGYTTRYAYNPSGQPISVTDPAGKVTTTGYDGAGRKLWTRQETKTGTPPKTSFVYDAAGNMTLISDPTNAWTTATYDNLNRQTKVTLPNNMSKSFTYDALGRKLTQKDALGNTTSYYYDAVGHLSSVVDPLGFDTEYMYDRVGNRAAVKDAQRRTTQYVYDPLNRVITEKGPDGVTKLSEYDDAGRTVATTNGRDQRIVYRYDLRDRLVEVSYPGARFSRYAYDAVGHRTSMSDWNGTTQYQYNALGWLQQTNDPWGNQLNYTYDPAGHRTELDLKHSGGTFVWKYGYDDLSRLTSLQSPGVATANTFAYDQNDRLTTMSYANGDNIAWGYDTAGQLTSIKNTNAMNKDQGLDPYGKPIGGIINFAYTFDTAGRRTRVTRSGSGSPRSDEYYKYDTDSRLIGSGTTAKAADQEYYFDLVGNRHSMMMNTGDLAGVSSYITDPANRLTEEFGPISTKLGGGRYHLSSTYDPDGNLIKSEKDAKEVTLYYYDETNHLLRVTNPIGDVTTYTYDGDGKRVRLQSRAGTTLFIYDGNEVLAEMDATGVLQVAYTRRTSGRLVSQWQKGETYWYHQDALGSTIALTDETGKVRNKYGYDDYGNFDPGTTEEIFNRFAFTGQAWDASTGLYFYKSRYYNPQAGRFLTQDTYKGNPWQPWTQNRYSYVGNNPVNLIDPTGHWPEWSTLGLGGLKLASGSMELGTALALLGAASALAVAATAAAPVLAVGAVMLGTFALVDGAMTMLDGAGDVLQSTTGAEVPSLNAFDIIASESDEAQLGLAALRVGLLAYDGYGLYKALDNGDDLGAPYAGVVLDAMSVVCTSDNVDCTQ